MLIIVGAMLLLFIAAVIIIRRVLSKKGESGYQSLVLSCAQVAHLAAEAVPLCKLRPHATRRRAPCDTRLACASDGEIVDALLSIRVLGTHA